jgi:hypothetical protein
VNQHKEMTNIRLVSIASDGESRRGSALIAITFKKRLSPDSAIYDHLANLVFMNLHVGDDDITADKDWKHVFKRLRNLLLRARGLSVGGVRITPAIIKAHLVAEQATAEHIRSLLNPEDKQDVKLAFELLKAIWSLPRTTTNTNPSFVHAREALWILGQFFYHLVLPYLCIDLSLSEQLEHLSAAAHLALGLYHSEGKECIPTLLYTDIMVMIKNVFFCVAKAKVDDPEGSFWIILLGTDRLEEVFGHLRTMVGNDANLDVLQLSWRLGSTAQISEILAKNPQWDRPPRRLELPALSRNSEALPSSSDHLKPRFFKGNMKVKDISLQTSWRRGRRQIETLIPGLAASLDTLERASSTTPVDILSPAGEILVTIDFSAEDNDSLDVSDESEASSSLPGELAVSDAEARVEIEDAIAELEEEPTTQPEITIFPKSLSINGHAVSKSRVLAQFSKHRKVATSTDRLKRVQHVQRYSTHSSESTHLTDPDATGALMVHDPIASLLHSAGCAWLCVGAVNNIRVDGQSVDHISEKLLLEDTVAISFQLMGLRPANIEEDPTSKYDWRTFSTPETTFTVPGHSIEGLNPVIASLPSDSSKVFYLLDSAFLTALAASMYSKFSLQNLKSIPKIQPSNQFPYQEASGALLNFTLAFDH